MSTAAEKEILHLQSLASVVILVCLFFCDVLDSLSVSLLP